MGGDVYMTALSKMTAFLLVAGAVVGVPSSQEMRLVASPHFGAAVVMGLKPGGGQLKPQMQAVLKPRLAALIGDTMAAAAVAADGPISTVHSDQSKGVVIRPWLTLRGTLNKELLRAVNGRLWWLAV